MALVAIGIDSGGTHTTCSVERGTGPMSSRADEASVSISDARGPKAVKSTADWIGTRLIEHTEPGDEVCVWIGAAAGFPGVSTPILNDCFEATIDKVKSSGRELELFIANDAVSILKSPPLLGTGVVAIVGTGSIIIGAHPKCSLGLIRRGGYEWPVGDIGSGIWMTVECARLLLEDLQDQGGYQYHSPLLDRLCDYFNIVPPEHVPDGFLAFARAEMLAAAMASVRPDSKRYLAGFVHPHLFDLARATHGKEHDPIAARVISSSVRYIAQQVDAVSSSLAAFTADNPNTRERLNLVIGGSIAANPLYAEQLGAALSECKYVQLAEVSGDAAQRFAALAWHYLHSDGREQKAIIRSIDAANEVQRLA